MPIDKKTLRSLPKKERRELKREMDRLKREAERKRRKRNKILAVTGSIVLVIALVASVGWIVITNLRIAHASPDNMGSDGLVLTGDGQQISPVESEPRQWGDDPVSPQKPEEGVAPITLYVDYGSADAASFDAANAEQLTQWATMGFIQLSIHPIALDQYDEKSDGYSTLAAGAAACVAQYQPTAFLAVNSELLKNSPKVTGDAMDSSSVAEVVSQALGGEDEDVSTCISDDEFGNWVSDASQRAANGPLLDTKVKKVAHAPLVLVNGTKYTGDVDDGDAFMQFVATTLMKDEKAQKDDAGKDSGDDSKEDDSNEGDTESTKDGEEKKDGAEKKDD